MVLTYNSKIIFFIYLLIFSFPLLILIKGLLLVTLHLFQKTPDNFHSLCPLGWLIPITISYFTRRVQIYQIYIFKIFYFYYFVQPYYFIFISLYLVIIYVIHDNTITCILHLRGLRLYCHSFRLVTCFLYVPLKYINIEVRFT